MKKQEREFFFFPTYDFFFMTFNYEEGIFKARENESILFVHFLSSKVNLSLIGTRNGPMA